MASHIPYPDRFFAAAKLGNAPLHEGHDLSDDIRLFLYGLYRQGVEGRCTEPRPSIWSGDAVAVAKWMAWNKMSSMNKMEAMFKYVQFLEEEIPTLWDTYEAKADGVSGSKLPVNPKREREEPGGYPEGKVEYSRSAPEKADSSAETDKSPSETASVSNPIENSISKAAPTAISESSEVQNTDTPLLEKPLMNVAPGEEKVEEASQARELSQPTLTARPPTARPQVSAKQGLPYPEKFYEAARRGQAPMHEHLGLGNDVRLFLYGLYQQGSRGPCTASRPSMWSSDAVELAKWMAWTKLSCLSQMEAMFKYVQFLEESVPDLWSAERDALPSSEPPPQVPAVAQSPSAVIGREGQDSGTATFAASSSVNCAAGGVSPESLATLETALPDGTPDPKAANSSPKAGLDTGTSPGKITNEYVVVPKLLAEEAPSTVEVAGDTVVVVLKPEEAGLHPAAPPSTRSTPEGRMAGVPREPGAVLAILRDSPEAPTASAKDGLTPALQQLTQNMRFSRSMLAHKADLGRKTEEAAQLQALLASSKLPSDAELRVDHLVQVGDFVGTLITDQMDRWQASTREELDAEEDMIADIGTFSFSILPGLLALRREWNTALRQWRELQKQVREQTSKRGGKVPATESQEEEEIMEEWANYLYL